MAKAKRRSAPAAKQGRFPETLIVRMPKGAKARIAERISEGGDPLVTQSDYLRKSLVKLLNLDLNAED